MNVYIREMKAHRKSLIIWCIGMIALIGSGMGKFAGFSSSGQSMNELMAQMPKSLQAFLGVGSLDMSTASGFYGVLFLYIGLLTTIHATMIGATIISKEERDKTVEFLFVKPMPRKKIIGIKLLAALTQVGILSIITWSASLLIVGRYSEGESIISDIGITMFGMVILQVLFLVIGTAIAASTKKPGKAATLAAAVLLVTFILSFAIDLSEKIEGLKYLTPFKYFEAKNVMDAGLELIFVGISVVLIGVLAVSTFVLYDKRDLHV
ncbi:ABC transporter permease subunit [Rossellomorea aquimaris]|uniref:ABC-2 type transport system permease protein n=1 Tax=Rossellomorea aquimaris TaxID=189382 RepID=A0A366EZK8_9BACI|nr:ABC transporter permease subunit [Rossellomorea aquimaris]RBP07807.1 ABC-2 type transport system permease protein [Rossellomorea aquimaris]